MSSQQDRKLQKILQMDTIAVIGCSRNPGKDAHKIPKYLHDHGYNIIPVNPYANQIFGKKAYDSLEDIEEEIDVVEIFRPSNEVADIINQALQRDDIKAVWTQIGIRDDNSAEKAREAGLTVVQDHCMMVEHRRLLGKN